MFVCMYFTCINTSLRFSLQKESIPTIHSHLFQQELYGESNRSAAFKKESYRTQPCHSTGVQWHKTASPSSAPACIIYTRFPTSKKKQREMGSGSQAVPWPHSLGFPVYPQGRKKFRPFLPVVHM